MMVETGSFAFTVRQWAETTGTDAKQADYECRSLYEKGLTGRERNGDKGETLFFCGTSYYPEFR